jgi:hypothetical protein
MMESSSQESLKYESRFKNLVDAILSSGNGLTCETGFKTISVSDEYGIIYIPFKIEQFYGKALIGPCDKLDIKASVDWPNKEIYFDTSETLRKKAGLFKNK